MAQNLLNFPMMVKDNQVLMMPQENHIGSRMSQENLYKALFWQN